MPAPAAQTVPPSLLAANPTGQAKLFNRWSYEDVKVSDISLVDYISLKQVSHPHTAGRYAAQKFRKAAMPITERLIDSSVFLFGRSRVHCLHSSQTHDERPEQR